MENEKKPYINLGKARETAANVFKMIQIIWNVDRWLFLGSAIAILIPAIVPFINIYIFKLVVDQVVKVIAGAPFNPAQFYPLLVTRLVTYFAQDVAFRTQNLMSRLLWTKVPIALNEIVLKKISSLDIIYFENDKFRDLLERVRESSDFRPQRMVDNTLFFIQSMAQLLISFVAIVRLNWVFIIVISLVAIPEFINETYQSKLSWGIWDSQSPFKKKFGYLRHLIQHHREIKELRIFSLAPKFLDEIKDIQENFYIQNKQLAQKSYGTGLAFNLITTATFIGIEVYIVFQALAKKVTVGDITFYTGVVSNFQNGLGGSLNNLNRIFEDSLYVKSLFEMLDLEPIIKSKPDAIKISLDKTPKIEFKDVSFTYPDTTQKVLKNFSLTINPGEKVALVGENGAGKSTIIKLLARFYDVDSGEILVDGVNIKDLDLESWYRLIGVLFQEFNRYEYNVGENIHFGRAHEKYDEAEIRKAAELAGASTMIEKLGQGYNQMLGRMFEGGIELSGGQWQKIALARAFLRNAPILVLDEPTSALDAKAESEVFKRVEKLSKDKTVIIISHRFSTVRNADKIYVIENGKIVESGNHQQLMKLDGQYAALFNLQAKGYR